ncbi:MAG TPA: glycosyltransferase family 2 protein [Gallionellaceae bacterium]|nr:glycosyltransferase family 2 protein [Gallionellaceae bacterium]
MRAEVSVIIPCYRCVDTVERAVDSVLGQRLLPMELLLVDDASDDAGATLAELQRLQLRHQHTLPIRVIPLAHNGGPGTARNAGWEQAQQPYLAFLDADDSWHAEKLKIQYQWMKAHPQVTLTGHQSRQIKPGDRPPEVSDTPRVRALGRYQLLFSNRLPARSVMLKRDIIQRFEAGKRHAEDYLLWLNIVLAGEPAWLIEAPLACSYKADFADHGLSGNLWKMERGELDTYKSVHRRGLISGPAYLTVTFMSVLKFVRRLLLAGLRRLVKNIA